MGLPAPVTVAVTNPDHWADIARDVESKTGVPLIVNVDYVQQFVAAAVPALFLADSTGQFGLLRGLLLDPVVAQCERNRGVLEGAAPQGVSLSLVGMPHDEPAPSPPIRMKLSIALLARSGESREAEQFWDVTVNQTATVAQPKCPSCGAPIAPGELACHYCHAITAQVVQRPLLVSRLRLF